MSTIELNTYITDAEWEVMRVVWANDRVTSKTVISVLKEKMDWTESTIKTILGRLVEKGVLNTEQEGRKFIYTANIVEKEAVRDYAEDIFNRICKKKVGNVIGSISYFKINQSAVNIDIQTSKTKSTLPIPPLLEDKNPDPNIADFTLEPQEGETSFLPNTKTRTMGYNGSFLGPVIRVSKGEQVNVHVNNKLKEATTVHWHGLEVEGEKDGGPHQGIEPGTTWEPSFTVNQQAATLWYHPHFGGNTATQVYKGLAGLFYVDDEVSKSLNIPKEYGVNDIPLVIQDS